jgi:diguanylate cyclase (GGDEF)-like protein
LKKINFYSALILIGITFTAYLISVIFQFETLSGILSAVNAFLAALFLFVTYFKSTQKLRVNYSLLCYALACLSWFLGDSLWVYCEQIIGIDPSGVAVITTTYLLTNVFLALGALIFAVYQFKNWNLAKLVLDIIIFSLGAILLIWIVFFNRSFEIVSLLTVEGAFSVISITLDLLVYTGIVVWYLSIRSGIIPFYMRLMSGGLFFFILADFYYYYIAYNHIYSPDSFSDVAYISTLLIIALGGLLYLYRYSKEALVTLEFSTNLGQRSKELLIPACVVLVILTKGFVLTEFLIFTTLFVVYIASNAYVQSTVKTAELLKKEMALNTELESLVSERTQKLREANRELLAKNRELSYLSNTDTLTNLYNRRYFLSLLEEDIAKLPEGQTVTLFFMDLDRFKLINDTYGHDIGDRVLVEISDRLNRATCDNSIISRMGGDEFVLACTGCSDNAAASDMAERIIAACSQEVLINGYVFHPAVSIGISIYPQDASDLETLIKNADIALYHAKSQGINKFAVYNAVLDDQAQKRNEIELFLRKSDFYQDLRLYYQPQFSIPDQKLTGAEALIRWISQDSEIMTPVEFIKIAEETDRINEIGIWVLKKAVLQIMAWNNKYEQTLKMGINISPKQLNSTHLLSELNQLTQNQSFNPEWLDIEITENIALDGEYRMTQIFDLFKSIGMSISIDDFGTGYASVSTLRHFSFDRIKIAKPLIDSITSSERGQQIVKAIVLLAKTIGIHTIAEGVETREQLDALVAVGCEQIQGFYLGRPVPADEFEALFLKDFTPKKPQV